jgi:Carboxypeptidase regulatory-like domain
VRGWTGLSSFGSSIWLALSIVCFGAAAQRAAAQSTTADILGTVTDSTGAILPGAKVTLTALATSEKREATANAAGEFVFNNLNPGHYEVEVTASGFKTFVVPDLLAAAGDRARVDAKLTAGAVDETVMVQAMTPLLQTDSSTVATTLTEKSVQDLPLNGRNFVQLAQMTAGANQGPQNGLTSGARPDDRRMTASISVNGQSDLINNEMIDGADNNERIIGTIGIRPSIDAISEVRVQSTDYTAEAGRTAGGVINIITKSGGNQFHGTLYEYFRNDVLNATNDVVQPQAGVTLAKSELRQNQFGGSLGGRIVKNKTFFFWRLRGVPAGRGRNPGR